MKKLATVAALAILAASSVSAEGFYVGAGISKERIKDTLPVSFKSTNAIALIGYDINDMISVEAETSLPVSKTSFEDANISVNHTAVFAKSTVRDPVDLPASQIDAREAAILQMGVSEVADNQRR